MSRPMTKTIHASAIHQLGAAFGRPDPKLGELLSGMDLIPEGGMALWPQ
jgi:hypothetical protein